MIKAIDSEIQMGSIHILHKKKPIKLFGLVKENILFIYKNDKAQSLFDLVYLKGCVYKKDKKFEAFLLKIYHCAQYTIRLTLIFEEESKRSL